MRALIEGVGALFGMPVSDGKDRSFRALVRVGIALGLMVLLWAIFAIG